MNNLDQVKRIFDISIYQRDRYDLDTALSHRARGEWESISSRQYVERIDRAARALVAAGIEKGDRVGIISSNRIEWCVLDQAITKAGAITVPVYPTLSKEDFQYIFQHSAIRLCFVASKNLYAKADEIRHQVNTLEGIYLLDPAGDLPTLEDFLHAGDDPALQETVDRRAAEVSEDDVATLIYTSGTTGKPKGVLLSHKNILSNDKICIPRITEIERKHALSFLPMSHIYERTVNYCYQLLGCSIFFAKSTDTIATDALHARPYIMMVVPRVVERLYTKISSKGEALKGWRKSIFDWAIRLGMRYRPYENSLGYRIKLAVARRLVLDKWRAALGGDLRIMISGSASLDARLCRLFCAAGIVLNEGYGLTETSPIVSTNVYPNRGLRIGSIGRPLENLDVRIGEDGEILVKGPSVMLGYYKEPELTAEAFDQDGYLHTGDIGHLEDGFLYITDRKKELFKTSGGKYITPQPIENALMQSRYIDQAMVVGNGKEHPSVILEPDFGELALWCEQRGIPTEDRKAMTSDEQVLALYKSLVHEVNKGLSNWERLRHFRLVADQWTTEGGELTPTLKIKRRRLTEKYAGLIADIYQEDILKNERQN